MGDHNDPEGKRFHFNNQFFFDPIPCGLIDVYQMGELCCERGYTIDSHEQICHEITYVISGKGYAYVDGEKIPMNEGDLIFNNMNYIHSIEADPEYILRYMYMGFRFSLQASTPEHKELVNFYTQQKYFCKKKRNDVQVAFSRGLDEFTVKTPYSDFLLRNYCQEILLLTFREDNLKKMYIFERDKDNQMVGHLTYMIIKYIENNICEVKSVKEVCEKVGYSYSYLSHFFTKNTGMSLQRYINMKKVEKAMELLKDSNLTVTQVSEKLRYESVNSFSKAFRRTMGFPPSVYAEREQNATLF